MPAPVRSVSRTAPTSAEVARRAGVSRTTVSFVLNDVRHQGISEATRERVWAAARELGYEPNAAARMLARGSAGAVAIVIPRARHLESDAFLAQLVAGVNEQCHRLGLKLLIESTEDEGREAGAFVQLVRSRRIDGLILVNLRHDEHEHVTRLAEAGIPMVVFGAAPPGVPPGCVMGTDNQAGARQAVGHLIGLGHRRIAHIGFAAGEFHAVSVREQAWRSTLQAHGLPAGAELLEHADISAASGYQAMQRLLARGVPFTGLFAGNDTIAFGAMAALREAGRRLPHDVAVVGYDDIPLAAFAAPPLTTVRTDPGGHALDAMRLLGAQLDGETPPPLGIREPAFIVRASCGAAGR